MVWCGVAQWESVTHITNALAPIIWPRFPADFLTLIGTTPLQPEPEILGGKELHDVVLPGMLIRGSSSRCPRNLWDDDLKVRWVAGETLTTPHPPLSPHHHPTLSPPHPRIAPSHSTLSLLGACLTPRSHHHPARSLLGTCRGAHRRYV